MSMTKKEVLLAYADGKNVQYNYATGNSGVWETICLTSAADLMEEGPLEPDRWRLKPTPGTVPLGPKDVPPGSVVRANIGSKNGWCAVGTVLGDCIAVVTTRGISRETFGQLQQHWEISRDGGKTWHRCEKEVSE